MVILITLVLSLIALFWSANHLVTGASGVALHYRLSPFLTGFILVALSTSTPEITVAINASLEGFNNLAIGNAIGTNIANIGLVLGITALLKPLRVRSQLLRREFPLLFLVMLFTYSLMLDGYLGVLDGCLFLLGSVALVGYFLFVNQQNRQQNQLIEEFQQAALRKRTLKAHSLSLLIGLVVLPISSQYLINSSIAIGHWFGISDLIIGLTIVAIGTSLPDLVTSIVATMKGADDIAIGNILGSNMLNLLAVMIFPSLIHPAAVSHTILWRDIPVMFLVSLILLWISYHNKKTVSRWHGGLLVLIYCCYMTSLILSATRH